MNFLTAMVVTSIGLECIWLRKTLENSPPFVNSTHSKLQFPPCHFAKPLFPRT